MLLTLAEMLATDGCCRRESQFSSSDMAPDLAHVLVDVCTHAQTAALSRFSELKKKYMKFREKCGVVIWKELEGRE